MTASNSNLSSWAAKHGRVFFKFVGVGAFAALVNWLSRMLFSLAMPLAVAIVCAYMVGMTTAYALNRRFVFQPTPRGVRSEFVRFALINALGLAQVFIVTMSLVSLIFPAIGYDWRPEATAHAIGVASPVITSYFGHRYFSFAQDKNKPVQ